MQARAPFRDRRKRGWRGGHAVAGGLSHDEGPRRTRRRHGHCPGGVGWTTCLSLSLSRQSGGVGWTTCQRRVKHGISGASLRQSPPSLSLSPIAALSLSLANRRPLPLSLSLANRRTANRNPPLSAVTAPCPATPTGRCARPTVPPSLPAGYAQPAHLIGPAGRAQIDGAEQTWARRARERLRPQTRRGPAQGPYPGARPEAGPGAQGGR